MRDTSNDVQKGIGLSLLRLDHGSKRKSLRRCRINIFKAFFQIHSNSDYKTSMQRSFIYFMQPFIAHCQKQYRQLFHIFSLLVGGFKVPTEGHNSLNLGTALITSKSLKGCPKNNERLSLARQRNTEEKGHSLYHLDGPFDQTEDIKCLSIILLS